ncbi:MAG TPA: LuxR C-terminal-related transcriptional regulator [Microlunatus sp.]
MEHARHVRDGVLHRRELAGIPDVALDSPSWVAWLDDPLNRSFFYEGSAGTLTARKERRGGRDGYWTAYRKRDGKLRKTYLGKAERVTQRRLDEAARFLADPDTGRATNQQAGHDRATVGPAAAAGADPLLLSKLSVPPPRRTVVSRTSLSGRIEEGLDRKLTVVSAPAGFGKSTLLSSWVAASAGPGRLVAWLSLDSRDDDPARFWRYFVTALSRLDPDCGATALALLSSPQGPDSVTMLTTVLNDLNSLTDDVVIVLDDYHLIEAMSIHDGLDFLLENLPSRVHLMVATRADPPLRLSRLRQRGELLELRAHDLRFQTEDAMQYLDRMGLDLSERQVAKLVARTEGWVGGLQMAALAMRHHPDLPLFVEAFSGSNRFVMDYLAEEVLSRQTEAERTFLLETSILDRMCAPLCEAVTGDHDSQQILERVERANLFMDPLDDVRGWYRYHQLFADVLNQRLRHEHPELVPLLHRSASVWFADQGLMLDAIPHALAGQDMDRAVQLIESAGMAVVLNHQVQTLLSWIDGLPDSLIDQHPMLHTLRALALALSNRPDAAEASLQTAERCLVREPAGEEADAVRGRVAVIRAATARFSGDVGRAVSLSRRALQLLPEGDAYPTERASARANLGLSYQVTGMVTVADEQPLADAVAAFTAAGALTPLLNCINRLGRFQTMQGRLRMAAATYQQATAAVSGPSGRRDAVETAGFHAGLGLIHLKWDDLGAAEQHLRRAVDLVAGALTVEADAVTDSYVYLARVQQARGQPDAARATLAEFTCLARHRGFFTLLVDRGEAEQARLALRQLALATAIGWAETRQSGAKVRDYRCEDQQLTLARVLLAQARLSPRGSGAADVLALLDALLQAAESHGRLDSVIEILVLRALAQTVEYHADSIRTLERALRLAAPEGYVRVFLDEGGPMATLLAELLKELRRSVRAVGDDLLLGHVRRLLMAFETPGGASSTDRSPLLDPLTVREAEVLELIATGMSNREIAARLYLATSTVKSYTNSIYRRLGVASRTEAIAEARARQLLAD